MNILPGQGRRPAGQGFTLVELLLTVVLLLLMVGAGILSFGSMQRGSQLDEGATQIESMFRYARAQAASTGRTVRVVFADGASPTGGTNAVAAVSGAQVSCETDPIEAPGRFELLPEAASFAAQLDDLVQVREVRFPGEGTNAPAVMPALGAADVSPEVAASGQKAGLSGQLGQPASSSRPIMFYPDGSSDSVEVVLGSVDREDLRRLAVKLSGLTGALRRRQLPSSAEDGAPPEVAEEPAP